MSAINVICGKDGVLVVTDGAGYDDAGNIMRIAPKAVGLPHLGMVVATRGPKLSSSIFAQELGGVYSSFDAMVAELEAAFPIVCKNNRAAMCPDDPDPTIQLVVAGWSAERNRPEAYTIFTGPVERLGHADVVRDDLALDKLHHIVPPLSISPPVPEHVVRQSGLVQLLDSQTTPPLDLIAKAYLELQRNIVHENRQWVGGFGLCHVVTRDGVSEILLCRWPDKLGLPIDGLTDWPAWRAANGWPVASAGVSKVA